MSDRRRLLSVALGVMLFIGTSVDAGTISAQGQASAKPDRALIVLFMRAEVREEGAGEKQLAGNWAQAKQWLGNFGIKDEQIHVREPVARLFQDQKKYLVQRVIITRKLTGKEDEDLEAMAQLVDQASARGLLPVSQMVMLALEQEPILPSQIPDVPNHFLFYLPADQPGLIDAAVKDGVRRVKEENARTAKTGGVEEPKLTELHVDYSSLQSTDVQTGQMGVAGISLGDVHATATVIASTGERNAGASKQFLSVSGGGKVEMTPQRVMIQTRISAADASLLRALGRIAEQQKTIENGAQSAGGTAMFGGVTLFAGNPGVFGIQEAGQGEVPAGAFRDVRVMVDRKEGESDLELRKRAEALARLMNPKITPEMNLNENPFVQVMWGPKDVKEAMEKASGLAMEDAKANAKRAASAIGAKVGAIVDVEMTQQENMLMGNPYLMMMSSGFAGNAAEWIGFTRVGERPVINLGVTVKFGAEVP